MSSTAPSSTRFAAALLAAALLSTPARALDPAPAQTSLTLAESLERAFAHNTRLLAAEKEVSIARARLSQARSQYYPKASLSLSYIRYRNETIGLTDPDLGATVLEAPIPNASGVRGNPLSENLYLGRVGMKQLLYDGGKSRGLVKLSKSEVKRAESMLEDTRRDVEYETARGFYGHLAAVRRRALLDAALTELDRLSAGADDRTRLALAAQAAEWRREQTAAARAEAASQSDYLSSMGVEPFSGLAPAGELDVPALELDLQTALLWAKQGRGELRETRLQEEADQLSINLSLAERYPVFLFGSAVEVRKDKFPEADSNFHAALSMNIPIFDGFSSFARTKESRHRADQNRLHRVEIEDRIDREVRTALDDYRAWRAETARREEENARFEDAFARLPRRAPADNLELLRWRTSQGLSVLEARRELCLAHARLMKATGRPLLAR